MKTVGIRSGAPALLAVTHKQRNRELATRSTARGRMKSTRIHVDHRIVVAAVVSMISLTPVAMAQAGNENAQSPTKQQPDDSNARPPVTKTDLLIIRRSDQILDSEAKWNRVDTRICPDDAKTFSLYCALEKASKGSVRSSIGAPSCRRPGL